MKCIYRSYKIINSYILLELETTKCFDSRVLNFKCDHCINLFPAQGLLQGGSRRDVRTLGWGDAQKNIHFFLVRHNHAIHEITGTINICPRHAQYYANKHFIISETERKKISKTCMKFKII